MQVELILIIVAFAAVQSVFGVGLLVFGTPSLLLLGYPFTEVLAYLLPASIVISLLQVLGDGFELAPIRKQLLLYTAPTVLVMTALVVSQDLGLDIRPLVGVMLIVTAAIRVIPPLREALSAFARRHLRWLLAGMGLIHGASNLGGGILTLLVSSVYEDKAVIRKHIAFGYLMMASIQVATLAITGWPAVDMRLWVLLPLVSAATYAVLGQRLFLATRQAVYQWSINLLVVSFGVLMLLPVT